ncbi:MAG: SRPBCC domain-containing protein [Mycobacteriales bacterium]
MTAATEVERGFTIVRQFDAPRELVFQAWTDPEQLHWLADTPPSSDHPTTVDLRVGGTWRLRLVEGNAEATSYMTGGIYREIVAPEKLVFTWGAVDGWPQLDPDCIDDGPIVTITLHEVNGATEMVFHLGFADRLTEQRVRDWLATGMRDGWTQTLERLSRHLLIFRATR